MSTIRTLGRRSLFSLLAFSALAGAASADDTTVTIKKGDEPDFTLVSDTADLAGEPFVADADARESWRKVCGKWKAEMREMNKDNLLIALQCGAPRATTGENAVVIYRSTGSYKVRVRVRNEKEKTKGQ